MTPARLNGPRWRPAPLLQASVLVHGAALGAGLWQPGWWPWLAGGVVANHAAVVAAGLWPRSQWLGENWVRLPEAAAARGAFAITIDDGPDPERTPRVLDLLDELGAKASFFCIGRRAQAQPALCRAIVARGHRVENHGQSHSNAFSLFGPGRMRRDIAAAQAALSDITGQAPRFFRPTAGLSNPFLAPVLHGLGLRHASWTRRGFDTRTGDPATVQRRLLRGFAAGDILLLHDGHAARAPDGQPVLLHALPAVVAEARRLGLRPETLFQSLE
ncbi:polysaccharide deacetylase family protein [Hydrogenophaga sp. YM1]|uniref:polysaccharide deacetylase family protein n=1 Tax=Hydrogenophaga sp. YM1 TaxID=2806262 RepID=UPI00195D9573|nr:polysaccharide deacetylase family protein [Hydrogenophaga sp. YM1]QRR36139.1 polysaccharide deacetylase family protein [Hydrogenophaga sp. YM1]